MILVVDDDEDVRSTITHMLGVLAYPFEEARDGTAALNAVRSNRYQLMILDHYMPGLNGEEVEAQARQTDRDLPVVFVTAMEDASLSERVGRPVLSKPFLLGELADLIERHSRSLPQIL